MKNLEVVKINYVAHSGQGDGAIHKEVIRLINQNTNLDALKKFSKEKGYYVTESTDKCSVSITGRGPYSFNCILLVKGL